MLQLLLAIFFLMPFNHGFIHIYLSLIIYHYRLLTAIEIALCKNLRPIGVDKSPKFEK